MAAWTLRKVLQSYDVRSSFQVAELSPNHIKIKDIRLEDSIVIPHLLLGWKFTDWYSVEPVRIDFHVENVGLPEAQALIEKISPSTATSPAIQTPLKQRLVQTCDRLVPMQITGKIDRLNMGQANLNFALSVNHHSNEELFKIASSGEHFRAEVEVDCGFEALTSRQVKTQTHFAVLKQLKVDLPPGFYIRPPFQLKSLSLTSDDAAIAFAGDSTLQTQFNFKTKVSGLVDGKAIQLALNIAGSLKIEDSVYSVEITASDSTRSLYLQDAQFTYGPPTDGPTAQSQLSWSLSSPKSFVRLSSDLSRIYSHFKSFEITPKGYVYFRSQGQLGESGPHGRLQLRGKDIDVQVGATSVQGINFRHEVSSFESFSSPKQQSLSIDKLQLGAGIEALEMIYQLKNPNDLRVSQFSISYDGAHIESTSGFKVDLLRQNIKDFRAKVTELKLEKLLTLALQDQVKAEGLLSGEVELDVENKKPKIHGHLFVNGPGWIQYRPGPKPEAHLQLSDGPMEILNAYLYDFRYQQLSVDIRSNEHYKMTLALKSLGHNPEYLQGKPLKLNINIEQNLLAALQAMVLTYDLPDRLREHFEKVGNP